MYKGGNISPFQGSSSFGTKGLKQIHMDKRILPLMNDEVTQNVSINEKVFENIPVSGNAPALGSTCRFDISAQSNALISLSESYFVANITITANGTANSTKDYSLLPFASHLFVDQIQTKLSSTDVGDSHDETEYAVSAFHKQVLLKPREEYTYSTITNTQTLLVGAPSTTASLQMSMNDYSSDVTLESLGLPNETVDCQVVNPGVEVASGGAGGTDHAAGNTDIVRNHNAVYYKNLVDGYKSSGVVGTTGTIEFIIRPTDGVWMCKNYLPSNIQGSVTLKLASMNKFLGMIVANTTYAPTVTINNLSLMLCRVVPTIDAMDAVNSVLLEKPFIYNIMNSRTESRTVLAGTNIRQTFGSLLAGIIPNVVLVSFVNQGTFDRTIVVPDVFSNNWLDTHTLSSGLKRKQHVDDDSFTGALAAAGNEPVHIPSIVLTVGSKQIPKSQAYCNYNTGNSSTRMIQQTYDAYVSQCIDSDRPFLSYSHWLNSFTPYVFNLTNGDQGLFVSTDETQTGTLTLQVSFDGVLASPQYMFVTGIYFSELSIDNSRAVTRLGY